MIPAKPDTDTRAQWVENIVARYESASADQTRRGISWYPTAHQLADMMTDGDARTGAGVIAALSANKSWGENTKLAVRAFGTGEASGHTGDNIRKVTRIMSGEDPETVLPMHSKTGQFFLCLADPQHPTAVCVDRHAHDVAVGVTYGNEDRGLGAKGRYNAIADAYREAARRLGVLPSEVQAVTWVVHMESLRGVGTRNHH